MVVPNDWDKPSGDNAELCQKFEKEIFTHGEVTLPYRLFRADTSEKVPLVLFLHGADAVGTDNEKQLSMHEIGTMFAREAWQKKHPCHILAPQYHHGLHWSAEETDIAVHALLRRLISELSVDKWRIYIYGYSAGAVGTLRYVKEHPSIYAAALSICGATNKKDVDVLKTVPLWMVHASDDQIVKASYRETDDKEEILYHMGSRDIQEYFGKEASRFTYTEYPKGYMNYVYGVNAHCSWVVVSDPKNKEYAKWMFEQEKRYQ